ncbi:putative inner membrane protein [Salmonella enterica]|nr:putative inner membrane protein [Salmonella enterica]
MADAFILLGIVMAMVSLGFILINKLSVLYLLGACSRYVPAWPVCNSGMRLTGGDGEKYVPAWM